MLWGNRGASVVVILVMSVFQSADCIRALCLSHELGIAYMGLLLLFAFFSPAHVHIRPLCLSRRHSALYSTHLLQSPPVSSSLLQSPPVSSSLVHYTLLTLSPIPSAQMSVAVLSVHHTLPTLAALSRLYYPTSIATHLYLILNCRRRHISQ